MDRILLPLRSNAGWFTNADTQSVLESRLKNYAVTFDKILVQDGRYSITLWKSRACFELMVPSGQIGFPRHSVEYFKPENEPLLLVGGHALGQGPAEAAYEVDFEPLFRAAGLKDADYVEWLDGDITDQEKGRLADIAKRRLKDDTVPEEFAHMSAVRRENILTSLLIDTVIAAAVEAPFATDFHAKPLIEWNNEAVLRGLSPAVRPQIYEEWVLLGLPDFTATSWDDVHRVRDSAAGRDYREMLRRIESDVIAATLGGESRSDIEVLIRRALLKELLDEVAALAPTVKHAAMNAGWSLIPLPFLGNALSAAFDLRSILQFKQSWVSLLHYKA